MAACAVAVGAADYQGGIHKLAKRGMLFNGDAGAKVMNDMWDMCQATPTQRGTPYSKVFIHSRMAKEFDGVSLSDWVKALDDEMAVACCMVARDLTRWKEEHGEEYLTWDRVERILSNSDYVVKDGGNTKRINDTIKFDETTWFQFDAGADYSRKKKVVTWFKNLFSQKGEHDILDNSVIVQEGTLDRLASLAAKSGTAIECPQEFFLGSNQRSDKVMEIGVIRFPRKGESKIKLFRLKVFAFFSSKRVMFIEHVESGFEVEYKSMEFKPNTAAIDKRFAEKAREVLKNPATFDF